MRKFLILINLFFLPLNNVFAVDTLLVKERVEAIKDCYTQCPEITMTTKVNGLYQQFYLKDYAFVQEQISKRENTETLDDHLKILDQYVAKNFKDNMSFADLNFIARIWVFILSNSKNHPFDLNYYLARYNYALNMFNKHGYVPMNVDTAHYTFVQSSGIVIPHVSETGIVPVLEMNEGFGFEYNNRIYSIDFLAVGTDQSLSFDYLTNQNNFDAWYHDFEHLMRAERMISNKKKFQKRINNIATLRKEIKKIDSVESNNQAELAFFKLFHESQESMHRIKNALAERIEYLQKKEDINPTDGFNSIEQYYSYVGAAKDLGLECGNGDIIEQYKAFLDHLLKGYIILLGLADFHDVP